MVRFWIMTMFCLSALSMVWRPHDDRWWSLESVKHLWCLWIKTYVIYVNRMRRVLTWILYYKVNIYNFIISMLYRYTKTIIYDDHSHIILYCYSFAFKIKLHFIIKPNETYINTILYKFKITESFFFLIWSNFTTYSDLHIDLFVRSYEIISTICLIFKLYEMLY